MFFFVPVRSGRERGGPGTGSGIGTGGEKDWASGKRTVKIAGWHQDTGTGPRESQPPCGVIRGLLNLSGNMGWI